MTAFNARDYAAAETKLAAALELGRTLPRSLLRSGGEAGGLLGRRGQDDGSHQRLDRLEPGTPNLDQIYAARSYVLAKQGKVAESRAALAKARQLNRTVSEFKD